MSYNRKENQLNNLYEKKEERRFLRTNGTSAEAVLWLHLKRAQVAGFRFRRQFSIGPYVLDFYCPSIHLCVELDGSPHYTLEGAEHDLVRTEYLERCHDIEVIRFENRVVFENIERVVKEIETVCEERLLLFVEDPSVGKPTAPLSGGAV